ncbi:MAG: GTPase ObgE [Candidatus Merdivicinus sp.]
MFVDRAKIKIKAGDGGNGAVSFHREKYVANGGPDGGDGGRGGNVVFVADRSMDTLVNFRFRYKFEAQNGQPGGTRRCSGKSGEDLVIRVPYGTVIREAESGQIMADISTDEPVILAHGGKGGAGNQHFATATRQIPRFSKPGLPGECFEILMELKLLADVGLVGFPNVGKSTFISVVSAARPKIANYHFTTLQPVLGVVRMDEDTSFVMADIPGLVEGASEGVGLGHDFLRHVERCRLILHLVDVSGSEGRDPIEDFEKINFELANFSAELAEQPQIVLANKCDLATPEQISIFREYIEKKGLPFFEISAATTQGTREVIQYAAQRLQELPPVKHYEPEFVAPDPNAPLTDRSFTIRKENGVYYVDAPWLEPIFSVVNPEDYESMQYFQRVLRSSGIIAKLEEMGIQEGDTVDILDFQFDFIR